MSEGFMSGYMQGAEFNTKQQMAKLSMQEESQTIEKNALAIQGTKDALAKQRIMMQRLQDVNHQSATDPSGQARSLSAMMMNFADAAFGAGMPEQGAEYATSAGKLLENTAKMDEQVAKTNLERAETGGRLADWVLDAKDDKEAMARWQKSLMLFQNMYGKESPYAKQPFSRELVQGIRAQTQSMADQEKLKLTKSEEDRNEGEATSARARARLDTQKIETEKARKVAMEKAGGKKATKAEQQQADAQADAMNDIDHMLDQLQTLPNDPTGIKGRYHHFAEFAGSVTGGLVGESGTGVTKFHEDIDSLKLKLSRAMGTKQYTSKATQEIINQLVDLKAAGTSRETAAAKLEELKDQLKAQLDKGPIRPSGEDKVMTFEEYIATQGGGGE